MNKNEIELLTGEEMNKVCGGAGPLSAYPLLIANLAFPPVPTAPGQAFASAGDGGETAGSFNPTAIGD